MKGPAAIILIASFVGAAVGVPALIDYPSDFGETGNPRTTIADGRRLVLDRLPPSITPSVVRLEMTVILDEGSSVGRQFTAPGKVWITGTPVESTSAVTSISINYRNISINQAATVVTDSGTNSALGIQSQTLSPAQEMFTINLVQPLSRGREYTVHVEFTSVINAEPTALYYSTYVDSSDGAVHTLASTDFQAPDARQAFPCMDEPQFKPQWDVSIVRMNKYSSLSNMNLIRTETVDVAAGWSRDVYNRSVPMSSYLVAFAVSEYRNSTSNGGFYGKPVGVWGPRDLIDQGEAAFSPDFSAKLMAFMEEYYGVEYSLPKMDKISIPNFSSGAMENWGLNTYRPSRLLHVEERDTLQDLFSLTNTISHELVHQWFGNHITCTWWDDLWVQEGAATYYAPVGVGGVGEGRLLPMETLITASVQRSFQFDASNSTHPIHNTGVDPSDVAVLFDTLTYHKGAALIRMMNAFLSEAIYKQGMTSLLKEKAFGSVTQDEMFSVLDRVAGGVPNLLPSGVSVTGIMRSWTLMRGFPVVSVERDSFTSRVTFTQSHYVRDRRNLIPDATRWTIPVALFTPGETVVNTRPAFWMLENQTSVSRTIRDNWFVVNPQSQGYYRVEYKGALLDLLIEQLHSNHSVFDVQTRSQLVDDNLNLAFAGYANLTQVLDLTLYLQKERELFPFVSFFTNMAAPYKLFPRSSSYPAFKNYILTLVSDALAEIGFDAPAGEAVPTTMLRTRLYEWACNNGHSGCVNHAKNTFANWVANPNNVSAVFPDLQGSVYCTAVANGGDVEWNFVYQQYLTSLRDVHQLSLLRALACSKTSFRLNNLLDLAIDPSSGIRSAQRVVAMQAVAGNSAGTDITFNFIRNNYDTIVRRFNTGMVSSVLTTIAGSLSLPLERGDLERFLSSKPELPQSSLAVVDANIEWMADHFTTFRDFISTLVPAGRNAPLEWWQESIVYQIYPRSFQDSNGDGVGDINGMTSRLDYFVDLGVEAIWVSPIYQSPMKDFGYDISNFTAIEPIFGTIDDFTAMAAAFRERGLKLIMDFVPNHSSDLHPWFIKSCAREDPYTDYYVWKDPIGLTPSGDPIPPNNWTSVFGGSMWEWHAGRAQFYLHQFVKEQPDLNFENRVVWDEILDAIRFWLDKGVDGFRVDAVPHMFEDQRYLDEPPNPDRDPAAQPDEHRYYLHPYTFNLPQVLDFLAEVRALVDNYSRADGTRRVMMVEATVGLPELMDYYGTPERPIAHFPFNFHLLGVRPEMTAREVLDLLDIWNTYLPQGEWATSLIGNHDNRRASTRFTSDGVDLANMLNLLVKGTAVTYYGEEIGMEDTWISWEDTVDPAGCNMGPDRYETFSRDPARTPMQWDNTTNAGFSSGNRTWLPLNPNYGSVNVLNQTDVNGGESHLKVYKDIVGLRKRAVWKYGDYQSNATSDVVIFTRTTTPDVDPISFVVIANFGNNTVTVNAQEMINSVPSAAVVAITSVNAALNVNVGENINTNQVTLGAKNAVVLTFPSN